MGSGDYNIYLENLLTIARFYDEHYTNNLWENIVHEAIKNMDINFSNPSKDEDITDYRIGIDNIHGLMLAYARQFDDIKLSIENIKSSNTVSYDGNNNIPDYSYNHRCRMHQPLNYRLINHLRSRSYF